MKKGFRIVGMVCLVWGYGLSAFAGYVLNTDGNYTYAGTVTGWTENTSLTGKWIQDCTVTLTDRGLLMNGVTDGNLTLDAATVTYEPKKGNGTSLHAQLGTTSNATLTLNNGSQFYWKTDDTWDATKGGGYSYGNVASSGNTATININSGSLLDVKRSYFGNDNTAGTTSAVTLNVHGGTLEYSGTLSGLYLAHHNPITITIADGGKILSSHSSIVISNDGSTAQSNASTVKIIGNSTMQAVASITFGQKAYGPSAITFLADNSGLGKMIAGTTVSRGNYGTFALGIDHTMAVMDSKAYEVVSSTEVSWANDATGLWTTNNVGGHVTATLNPAMKQGGADYKLTLGEDVDVTETLASKGWAEISSGEYYSLTLLTNGLEGTGATQAFVDWYNLSDNESTASRLADNLISLSAFAPGQNIFAWDFSGYTAATVTLQNIGAQVAPEPATWFMLLLGTLFLRRKH